MRLTLICARKFRVAIKIAKHTLESSNLPESYVKRAMERVYWKAQKGPQYRQKDIKKTYYHFGLDRPWTEEFRINNGDDKYHEQLYVEPLADWNYFKGDRVEVLVGKDKGKIGIISYMVQERNWVIVEGLNCTYKMIGAAGDFPGLMIKDELPLLVPSEVALIDPSDNKRTDVDWRYTEEGQRVRVSMRTGRLIPIPLMAQETYDYKSKALYNEQPKDTRSEDLTQITFKPCIKTFEMDIMDQMGIKEHRIPGKTYWY